MLLNSLNKEEIAVGFFIQLPFYFLIGLWVLPLAVLSGLLWAIGGDGYKWVRRFGVPALTTLALIYNHHFIFLAYPFACLAVCLGYGEKSWLWNGFMDLKGDRKEADYLTRLITYILYWITFGVFI